MSNVYTLVLIMDNQITFLFILDIVNDKVYDELKSCLEILKKSL